MVKNCEVSSKLTQWLLCTQKVLGNWGKGRLQMQSNLHEKPAKGESNNSNVTRT